MSHDPVESDRFKTADATSYDPVALRFAHFTDLVTKPLAETMVRLARVQAEHRVLDVGTGSGIVALAAARRLREPGSVIGVDLSKGMLRVARQKADEAGLAGLTRFEPADAEALPFEDESFDRVLSLFALLHFPHPQRALAEMFRVLKPGGQLVIGIGSGPPWSSIRGWRHRLSRIPDLVRARTGRLLLATAHLEGIVRRLLPPGPEETALARDRGARIGGALNLVRTCEFQEIRTGWEHGHVVLSGAEDFWNLQSTFSSIARKRLQAALPEQLVRVRREFDDQCSQVLARDGTLEYHSAAFLIQGRRPSRD